MSTRTLNTVGISYDTRDFRRFAKALRKGEPLLARSMRVKLRASGQLVADRAKANISPYSSSIPPTIKVRTSSLTVAVIAGGKGPLAGLMETGNKGSSGGGGTFRHPVFGNMNNWVDQTTHPFLAKALADKQEEAIDLIREALDETIAEVVADSEF